VLPGADVLASELLRVVSVVERTHQDLDQVRAGGAPGGSLGEVVADQGEGLLDIAQRLPPQLEALKCRGAPGPQRRVLRRQLDRGREAVASERPEPVGEELLRELGGRTHVAALRGGSGDLAILDLGEVEAVPLHVLLRDQRPRADIASAVRELGERGECLRAAPESIEQRDQPATRLELGRRARDRVLECCDRARELTGLFIERRERRPREVAARASRPACLVRRAQLDERAGAAMELDDARQDVRLEVRRELHRTRELCKGLGILSELRERIGAPHDQLAAAHRIGREQLLGGAVAPGGGLVLVRRDERVATLGPQSRVARRERDEPREVPVDGIGVTARELEQRAQDRRLLARLRVVERRRIRRPRFLRRRRELAEHDPARGVELVRCDRALEHAHRERGVAGGAMQMAQHDERGPGFRTLGEPLVILGDEEVEAAMLAVQLDELTERSRVVRIAGQDRLVARDHRGIERIAPHAPVVGVRGHPDHAQREREHELAQHDAQTRFAVAGCAPTVPTTTVGLS